MAKKTTAAGFDATAKQSTSASVRNASRSNRQGTFVAKPSVGAAFPDEKESPRSESNPSPVVMEKPGKGITMQQSRQRMLKQLDGSFKRLA